jgi:hypothetical protein
MNKRARHLLLTLIMAALLLLAAGVTLASGPAEASRFTHHALRNTDHASRNVYHTENAFIVSIDGLRNTEGFDAPDPAKYVPHLWNDLRPQGAIYRNFYNRAQTYTTPGNYALVNGAWEPMPNIGLDLDLRARTPTLFEHYRRAHPELPKEKAWAVVGKANVHHADYSLHPLFGASYGASLSFPAENEDEVTWAEMQRVMDAYHPRLVFFHLGEVDMAGHSGKWITYTNAIRAADQIVYELWQKIQADPSYADRTTLIVTNDHGRHDDEHGGFHEHGGICEGDKRLIFLALGPDIRPGIEITTVQQQIDVAPTVAELMGIDAPLGEGQVLWEMLQPPASVPPSHSRQPAVAVNGDGVHVVWTDDRDGHREVYYKRSTDDGRTWSEDLPLSASGVEARFPAIAADEGVIHVVWLDYRDGNWAIYHRKHTAGEGWSPEVQLALSVVEDPPRELMIMLWQPVVAMEGDHIVIVAPGLHSFVLSLTSTDGGVTWTHKVVAGPVSNPQEVDLALEGGQAHVVWYQVADSNWEVFYNHSTDGGLTWVGAERLTNDDPITPYNSYDPTVAVADGAVHVVWADDRNGAFQLFYRRRGMEGIDWASPVALTPYLPDGGAWRPDLVATEDGLRLVWEDYRDGNAEIYTMVSTDGGLSWGAATRLTDADGYSVYPRAAALGETAYFVWQDNRSGAWEVYCTKDRFRLYLPAVMSSLGDE